MSIKKYLISIFSRNIEVRSPLKLFLEPERGSREQAEASTGIVEVATASAGVKRIQGRNQSALRATTEFFKMNLTLKFQHFSFWKCLRHLSLRMIYFLIFLFIMFLYANLS